MVASARAAALSRIFSRVEEQAQAWRRGHQQAALRETRCCRSARASTVCVPRRSCVTRAADRRTSAARGLACRHACMHADGLALARPSPIRGSWRQNRCAEGPSPARCRGSPRQRAPISGSSAINDSFDYVQKRSRAGVDNLYKALSRGLTLIITLINFLPTSKCGGARRWSRVAELWVGPGREGGGRSGGRCAARGGHGRLQREACRARVGAERARPCRNSSKITPLVACRLATLLSRRGPAPGALTNCSAGIDTSLSVRGIRVDAPRPRGRRALPHHASMVCMRFSSPLARPTAGMAWLGDALLSSRIHRLPATGAHTPSSPGTVVQLSTGRRTGCRAWRAA